VAEVEYEPRDVNVRAVAKAVVALGLLAAFGAAASFGAYRLIAKVHDDQDPPAAPLAPREGRVPPMPRLQYAPLVDLSQLRAEEQRRLSSVGWTDRAAGKVHIRIEDAMRLYVERARATGAGASTAPATSDVPAAAAGPSGTATMPPAAATPSPGTPRSPQ
jgi:hypothetical protein